MDCCFIAESQPMLGWKALNFVHSNEIEDPVMSFPLDHFILDRKLFPHLLDFLHVRMP